MGFWDTVEKLCPLCLQYKEGIILTEGEKALAEKYGYCKCDKEGQFK